MKERIIGAVVLVIIVVLLVPVFLDGPPSAEEVISERLLLPGQAEQDIKTVVLERERSVPIPAASSGAADTVAREITLPKKEQSEPQPAGRQPKPEPVVEKPEKQMQSQPQAAPPKLQPAVDAASTTGMWAVQLGSFSNKLNAEKLAASLRKQGYAAFLSQLEQQGGPLHRVRIGPQKDRESAEAMEARLQKVGHKGQVVPHP